MYFLHYLICVLYLLSATDCYPQENLIQSVYGLTKLHPSQLPYYNNVTEPTNTLQQSLLQDNNNLDNINDNMMGSHSTHDARTIGVGCWASEADPDGDCIIGIANTDYPVLGVIPSTSFTCPEGLPGFFADTEAECQVWHYCRIDGLLDSFLCPNGTLFNQLYLVCDWWYNVRCEDSSQFISVNERLYQYDDTAHQSNTYVPPQQNTLQNTQQRNPYQNTQQSNLQNQYQNVQQSIVQDTQHSNVQNSYQDIQQNNLQNPFQTPQLSNLHNVFQNTHQRNLQNLIQNTQQSNLDNTHQNAQQENPDTTYQDTQQSNLGNTYQDTQQSNLDNTYQDNQQSNFGNIHQNAPQSNLGDIFQTTQPSNLYNGYPVYPVTEPTNLFNAYQTTEQTNLYKTYQNRPTQQSNLQNIDYTTQYSGSQITESPKQAENNYTIGYINNNEQVERFSSNYKLPSRYSRLPAVVQVSQTSSKLTASDDGPLPVPEESVPSLNAAKIQALTGAKLISSYNKKPKAFLLNDKSFQEPDTINKNNFRNRILKRMFFNRNRIPVPDPEDNDQTPKIKSKVNYKKINTSLKSRPGMKKHFWKFQRFANRYANTLSKPEQLGKPKQTHRKISTKHSSRPFSSPQVIPEPEPESHPEPQHQSEPEPASFKNKW